MSINTYQKQKWPTLSLLINISLHTMCYSWTTLQWPAHITCQVRAIFAPQVFWVILHSEQWNIGESSSGVVHFKSKLKAYMISRRLDSQTFPILVVFMGLCSIEDVVYEVIIDCKNIFKTAKSLVLLSVQWWKLGNSSYFFLNISYILILISFFWSYSTII